MKNLILTCNAGSNSLKCGLCEENAQTFCYFFEAENIHNETRVTIRDKNGRIELKDEPIESGYKNALSYFSGWHEDKFFDSKITAAGHRIVHGGNKFTGPTVIDWQVRQELERLIPLAPLHQPYNLKLIDILEDKIPGLKQVACFDTSFHHTQPWSARQFALPRELMEEEEIYRYGFHGLSYEYISGILKYYLEDGENKRVVVAHLGSGASMCAMRNGKSIATTMGFSALEGLMMGSRCGELDPGVVLYLMKEKNMNVQEVEELLYEKSGLLGVSGISSDMRDLNKNPDRKAQEAVELFCYMAARQLGGLIMTTGGLDSLVFTGGMGAKDPVTRKKICMYLEWMSLKLDEEANENNKDVISKRDSAVDVFALPTNEEAVIAQKTAEMVEV